MGGLVADLLIGCGNSRRRKLPMHGRQEWQDLVTMDFDPNCGADIAHDLDVTPWPIADNSFDECHAYEVLEHLGTQGDWRSFFRHFYEIWRVLKPGGFLCATVPSWKSEWAWADPSHTRVIAPGSLVFLSQSEYAKQVGKTAMTDFRHTWKGDFEIEHTDDNGHAHIFVLRAVK